MAISLTFFSPICQPRVALRKKQHSLRFPFLARGLCAGAKPTAGFKAGRGRRRCSALLSFGHRSPLPKVFPALALHTAKVAKACRRTCWAAAAADHRDLRRVYPKRAAFFFRSLLRPRRFRDSPLHVILALRFPRLPLDVLDALQRLTVPRRVRQRWFK